MENKNSENKVEKSTSKNQTTRNRQNQSSTSIDKNLLYIGVFTVAIIIIVIAVLALKPSSKNNIPTNAGGNNVTQTATALSVINENGDQKATLDKSIKVRKIDFSKTVKQVKAFEAKQKDTLDNPSEAKSQDGYTYITYRFNPEKPAMFFGAQVAAADSSSMLTYVFKNESLIEVRIQYGAIGATAYDTIVASNNSTYGQATYSRTYNNGTKQSWWKTKTTTLDVIFQDQGIVAYYRVNK